MSIQAVGWVLDNSRSTGVSRLVLIALANHHNGISGQCNPGYRLIAKEARCGKSAVQVAVYDLVALGELVVDEPGDNRHPARYALPFVGVRQTDAASAPAPDAASAPAPDRTVRNRKEPLETRSGNETPNPSHHFKSAAEIRAEAESVEPASPEKVGATIHELRQRVGR